MRLRLLLFAASLCLAQTLLAQDPVKVDAKHYKVMSENDKVRIVKVHYGPHEKSVMHSHPNLVAVFMSDSNGTFHMPDGSSQPINAKGGDAQYVPAGTHNPEAGDKPMDVILVELKGGKSAAPAAKPAAKKAPAK